MRKASFIGTVLLLAAAASLAAAPTAGDRLNRLDAHLVAIAGEARLSRQIGGSVLVGGGAVMIAAFGAAGYLSYREGGFAADYMTPISLIGAGAGAALLLPGALILGIKTENETLPARYAEMPEASAEDVRQKIGAGETYLESLAVKGRDARYITGVGSLVLGLVSLYFSGAVDSILPVQMRAIKPGPDGYYYSSGNPLNSLYYLGMGLPALLIKSRPEREWDAYRRWAAE